MTEPTIDELIEHQQGIVVSCGDSIYEQAKLDALRKLKRLDAQPVPVEPEWMKSLLRQIKEREDDDANSPCQLLLVLAYACVNDFTHLQSALKLAQEERDKNKDAADAFWRIFSLQSGDVKRLIDADIRAEKAEALAEQLAEKVKYYESITTGAEHKAIAAAISREPMP
jgi:hypothetical protein